MSKEEPPKFELTAPRTEAAEKRIAAGKKYLDFLFKMHRRAKAEFMGTAFLIGHELNDLAANMPDGELEKFIRSTYGLADSTQQRWRKHALAIAAKVAALAAAGGQSPTVGLTKGKQLLLSGKKKFSAKEQSLIIDLVPEVMERKGMVEFLEDEGFVKKAKPDGGYRPSKEEVEAFLADKHPDLKGKTYEQLEPKIQREFRKWLETRPEPPSDIAERADDQGKLLKKALVSALAGKWLMAMKPELRGDCLIAAEKLAEKLKGLGQAKAETLKPEKPKKEIKAATEERA
jgi:hypothetical protein